MNIFDLFRSGKYPSLRAGSPGSIVPGTSGIGPFANGSTYASALGTNRPSLVPGTQGIGPFANGNLYATARGDNHGFGSLFGNIAAGIDQVGNATNSITPGAGGGKHHGGGGLAGLLAGIIGGAGGNQSNPVVDEINRQMGLLQSQAGASKADLLRHEQRAKGDLTHLYGHLANYISGQQGANNQDFRRGIRQDRGLFGQAIRGTRQDVRQAAQSNRQQLSKLGLDVDNSSLRATRAAAVSRMRGDRADLVGDTRFQRNDWNALSRQMKSDAKLEGTVQIGQVHRDTTKALADLSNTLQSQLGQLRMARAQAAASGQSNPLDTLSKELDLKKKLLDIKAAQAKLNGKSPSGGGSASQGFQAALQYLGAKGGKYSAAEQALLSAAQGQLQVPTNAGGGVDLSKMPQVKLPGGATAPAAWAAPYQAALLAWMQNKIATIGGNSGMGPATPQELAQLQRALRIAFKQD